MVEYILIALTVVTISKLIGMSESDSIGYGLFWPVLLPVGICVVLFMVLIVVLSIPLFILNFIKEKTSKR